MSNSHVLPTLAEFQAVCQQYRRYEIVQFLTAMGIILVCTMGLLVLHSNLYPWQEDKIVLVPINFAIFVSGVIWAGIRTSRFEKSHLQLQCRSCYKSLQLQSGIVNATGNCPHCGQRAIEIPALPENDNPLPPRMTRDEYEQLINQQKSRINYYFFTGVAGGLMVMGSAVYLLNHIRGPDPDLVTLFSLPLIFTFIAIPWFYWCRRRALRQRPYDELLNCPNCNTELGVSIVLATGKCQDCRRVVFSDSLEALEVSKHRNIA